MLKYRFWQFMTMICLIITATAEAESLLVQIAFYVVMFMLISISYRMAEYYGRRGGDTND